MSKIQFQTLFLLSTALLQTRWHFWLTSSPAPSPSPDANLGAIATITGAIIAGFFGIFYIIYTAQQNKKLARENERKQQENEDMQRRLDAASHRQQFEEDIEKSRYDDWLAVCREEQERERQRKMNIRATAHTTMIQAHTPAERDEVYRKALHADPNISQLQVLNMTHPMEVANVYVRLRLHQEAKLSYDIEPSLLEAEKQGDPNALLKTRFSFLEIRTQTALTPEDALQKYSRCIVLGDPGAGKSTLLKYLTLRSIDRQLPNLPHFPIHISLNDFAASSGQDLIGFAAKRWDEWYGFPEEEARAHMENHLANEDALLLFDALDETVIGGSDEMARASYSRVLEAIDRVATRYSKVPIVITARKAGYYQRAHMSGFTELEVLDFRPEEIKEFVNNWFKYHPAPPKHATAAELNTQLTQNPRIQSLATNPLLLCLIVMVYEARQDLPEKRASIYKECIDALLYRWDTSRDIHRRRIFKIEHKQLLLAEIAWHFHLQGRRYFPEDELLQVIATFLPTVGRLSEEKRAVLHEIEEENGMLKEQAHGWHGFLHLTLQEYLVAQHLTTLPNGLDHLLKHCGDPWWEEVMLLYAGSISDASPLLRALLKQEKKQWLWQDIFHTHLLWAGQCLTTKPRLIERTLRDETITRLFALLRKEGCYDLTREKVIKILLEIDDSTRDRMLFILNDKQDAADVRWNIAQVLGALGDKAVIPALLAILNDRQDAEIVRDIIIQALGALGDKAVIPALLAILNDKQDASSVRWNTAQAIGVLCDKTVIPALLAILNDKQDNSSVRWNIAQVLGALGDKAVIPALLAILNDKQDAANMRWRIPQALGVLDDKAVIPALLAILNDKQDAANVRWSVSQALGVLGDKAVIPALLAILKDKQDAVSVREDIPEALGALGDKAVIPALLAILKDKQDAVSVRQSSIRTLIRLKQYREITPYFYLITSPEYWEYKTIPSELIWDITSLRAFTKLLKHEETKHNIHRTLWAASQREKVYILMLEWKFIKLVRVVKK